jgi:hypothetical protein
MKIEIYPRSTATQTAGKERGGILTQTSKYTSTDKIYFIYLWIELAIDNCGKRIDEYLAVGE